MGEPSFSRPHAGPTSLRIAVVHSFYSSAQPSGENIQVEAEVEALRQAGATVRLFAARTDDLEGEPLYPVRAALRVASGWGRSPRRAIEQFQPDVVHVHNLFPNFGRSWVSTLTVPVVATLHNFRFSCAGGTLFRDGQLCTDCPDGSRWSGVRHGCYRGSRLATIPLALAQRAGPTADPVLARADRIVCLSERQRALLERERVPPSRLVPGTNFLPASLDPGGDDGLAGRHERSGCVFAGRLTPEKGVVELVEAWHSDEHVLTVVGDGPLRDEVRRVARGRPVEVIGALDREAVLALLARSHALVLPGAWPEVAPLSCIEALSQGAGIVVRTSSDLAATVERTGVGVAAATVAQMPGAVARLAAHDDLPDRCRLLYETRHTAGAWVERTLHMYRSLLGVVAEPGSGPDGASWAS